MRFDLASVTLPPLPPSRSDLGPSCGHAHAAAVGQDRVEHGHSPRDLPPVATLPPPPAALASARIEQALKNKPALANVREKLRDESITMDVLINMGEGGELDNNLTDLGLTMGQKNMLKQEIAKYQA